MNYFKTVLLHKDLLYMYFFNIETRYVFSCWPPACFFVLGGLRTLLTRIVWVS